MSRHSEVADVIARRIYVQMRTPAEPAWEQSGEGQKTFCYNVAAVALDALEELGIDLADERGADMEKSRLTALRAAVREATQGIIVQPGPSDEPEEAKLMRKLAAMGRWFSRRAVRDDR